MVPKKEIRRILKNMPPEPSAVEQWIRSECIYGRYLMYDGTRGVATCSHCGKKWPIKDQYKGKHGLPGRCPKCRSEVRTIAAGLGRRKLTEHFRILTFARKGKTVYARLWEVDVEFQEFGRAGIKKWLSAVFVINKDEQHYYRHRPEAWYGDDYWEKPKKAHLPNAPKGMSYFPSKYEITLTYRRNLKGIFRKTDCRYLEIPGVIELEAKNLLDYLILGMQYPAIELLAKAGFRNAVGDRIEGYPRGMLNWRGRTLQKILRLPRRHVRYLQSKNPTLREIKIFQDLTEEEKNKFPWAYVEHIARFYYRSAEEIKKEISDHAPLIKTLQYLDDLQYVDNQESDFEDRLCQWKDYLRIGRELGMDFRRRKNLYPEDLTAAHDTVAAQWESEKNAVKEKKIKEQARNEEYTSGDLQIIPAVSQEMLNKESRVLNHCVKTYGDRIANGSCWIWFIRKAEEPDKPYYTMETDTDGHMIQCRGKSNCSMTEEVKAFAEGFEHHLQKELEKERATA